MKFFYSCHVKLQHSNVLQITNKLDNQSCMGNIWQDGAAYILMQQSQEGQLITLQPENTVADSTSLT